MFRNTIIAAATAGLIGAGALAATTTPASATGMTYGITFGGPGWSVGIGAPGYWPAPQYRPHKVCQPIFQKVSYWHHGHKYWKIVKVSEKCYWTPRPPYPWPVWGHPW